VVEVEKIQAVLVQRFPIAIIHLWPIGPDITHRIAEDAWWEEDRQLLVRTPTDDIAPNEYPSDVGWGRDPEPVEGPDGEPMELCRGCLYVETMRPDLVRYGWKDLPGPDAAPASAA